jgi:hypothetical protein
MYSALREEHSGHRLVGPATDALARVEIELAEQSGAGIIEQPLPSGTVAPGTSVYEVQNDSPYRLQIILRGPEVIIEEIDECRTCTTYFEEPEECPGRGPIRQITMKPGEYKILVKSISDDGVIPYRGAWTFADSWEYAYCYYVVQEP